METIRYSPVGKEDIAFGTGTFEVTLADGRVVMLSQVDIGAILNTAGLSTTTLNGLSFTNATFSSTTFVSPTFTGITTASTVAADPTLALGIASKQYVDNLLTLPAVGAAGTILMSRTASAHGLAYVAALTSQGYGDTYGNGDGAGAGDLTNDITLTTGGCMDATGAYWIQGGAITKQLDAGWAVGTAAGGLDTGAVANSDYYIWRIARSDTGVVDALFSLSSTAPTMPPSYDFKRLRGWIKRVGGTIVACHTYETEGGGLELAWDAATLDVDLTNTLTTVRRTDALKVPLTFSTMAHIGVVVGDAVQAAVWVGCPDETDVAPSATAALLMNNFVVVAGTVVAQKMRVRTSATGTIAARSNIATTDAYRVSTYGFTWARRQ